MGDPLSKPLNGPKSLSARNKSLSIFILLWLILFLLYLPCAKAGWVNDTIDWLQRIRENKFWDYINIMQTLVPSFYQFTQFTTWIFYQLFHANPRAWFLLFITLHAANGTLIFIIFRKLFDASGVRYGAAISAGAVLLFCICPHVSEVIVWKACFHYLQGMLMMLAVLYWIQKYHSSPRVKYVWLAGITFLLSTFSLELFYLTPWFVLSLAVYYRLVLRYDKKIFRQVLLYFCLPLVLIFLAHIVLLRLVTGFYVAHLGDDVKQPVLNYLCKAPRYLFHILLFGRFFSFAARQSVYDFTATVKGAIIFYGLVGCVWIYITVRFKTMKASAKAAVLVFTWMLMCMAILCPVWISDVLLVYTDRYAYFLLPFIYLLLVYFLALLKNKKLAVGIFVIYSIINIYFTIKVNLLWRYSSQIVYKLSHTFPVEQAGNKTILMLNNPANMNGILMIGALPNSAFKTLYNVSNDRKLTNPVYDVVSYNMNTPLDGAHVTVINDSTIHVTLNQWGSWWWYGRLGAGSYENKDYRERMVDNGHWYELTLKRPAHQYLLVYQVWDQWKVVDMKNKGNDQN